MTDTSSQFERLSGILAASGSVAYEWDMASNVITWFDGALDAFGLSTHDAIATGDRFKSLICPEDVAFRQQTLSLIYRGSESYELEYRVRCAGGEHSWFQDQGSAEVSSAGKLLTLRGVPTIYSPEDIPIKIGAQPARWLGARGDFEEEASYHGEAWVRGEAVSGTVQPSISGSAEIVAYRGHVIEVSHQLDAAGVIIVNQNHWPGWSCGK